MLLCLSLASMAQEKPPYDRTEEVIYRNKRYRIHNSWLSAGAGWAWNTHRQKDQKSIGVDLNLHIKEQHFQLGVFTTGNDFTPANNYNFHLGYGLRKETTRYNLAGFVGPSASYFYRPLKDTVRYDISKLNNKVGVYICLQAVYKFEYDLGLGVDLFADYNQTQSVFGLRIVAYFSSAYRGMRTGRQRNTKVIK